MAHFTRVEFHDPSQLFWYGGWIRFWPYEFLTDPRSKTFIDDANIPSRIFTIWWCVAPASYYKSGQHIHVEVHCPTSFYRQLVYNQHLSRIADSRLFGNTSLIEATVHLCECKCRRTNSTLEVPANCLVKNVSIAYSSWWHRIAEATCVAVRLLASPPPSSKGVKRAGTHQLLNSLKTLRFLVSLPHTEVGGGEGA